MLGFLTHSVGRHGNVNKRGKMLGKGIRQATIIYGDMGMAS